MAVLKSQLQIKAGRTLGTQLVLGLGVRGSCQKAKLASRAEAAGNQYRSCVPTGETCSAKTDGKAVSVPFSQLH